MSDAVELQRRYYAETADAYDDMHVSAIDEHAVALGWLSSLIRLHRFESLLDVGAGTGRCLRFLKEEGNAIRAVGIEPVRELREVGWSKGLSDAELVEGNALSLPFEDAALDIVCSFGVLHHIEDHRRAVAEMCRVARRAVFISDSNNFGQGGAGARALKQLLRAVGLWRAFDLARTGGRGYQISHGDGLFYSYSLLDDVPVLRRRFDDLQFMSTLPSGPNLYRSAPHLAVFARA